MKVLKREVAYGQVWQYAEDLIVIALVRHRTGSWDTMPISTPANPDIVNRYGTIAYNLETQARWRRLA